MMIRLLLFAPVALLFSTANALPNGFVDEPLLQGPRYQTDLVFANDEHIFVSVKDGLVHVHEDVDGSFSYANMKVALDISDVVCTATEEGLGGIQVHPKFGEENRWIYLYYTFNKYGTCEQEVDDSPVNRLSRFVVNDDYTIDRSSEVVFFDTPSLVKDFHHGGRIEFGKDGFLYVTVGDGGYGPPAQMTSNLFGSVVRLTDTGEIPPGNPFVGQPDAVRCNENGSSGSEETKCLELYAIGFRNPFRFSMDPNAPNTRFFINDVGREDWEEVSECGDAVFGTQYKLGLPNYGWPVLEGPCWKGNTAGCTDASLGGQYVPPFHFYQHDESKGGAAAVGSVFIPNGIWPAEYDNAYFLEEYKWGTLFLVKDSDEEHCYTCNPPKSGKNVTIFDNMDKLIGIRFGPSKDCRQAMYYTSSANGGWINRLTYVGDDVSVSCTPGSSPTIPTSGTDETSAPPAAAPTPLPLATEGGYPGDLFPWASGDTCPDGFDYCGMLEFCTGDTANSFGYRLPCLKEEGCPCPAMSGPLIRLQSGNKYRLMLRNAAPNEAVVTNLHTHGLHIVGDGDGDDVIRQVSGGGNCLDYTWDVASDHPGGTYWYHAHHHGFVQEQVEGGAFGLLIVEDNTSMNPNIPAWAANERLLQIVFSPETWEVFGNAKKNEVIDMNANQWYRLRVSLVESDALHRTLRFDDQGDCTIHKVANDGIWRSVVPQLPGLWNNNAWNMTGASRADFAVNCATPDSLVTVFLDDFVAATLRIGALESNPYVMEDWIPERPHAFRDLRSEEVPEENKFSVRLGYDYVNEKQWDQDVPLATIGFDQVFEWTLRQTVSHPFHIHLYHMQVVTSGGCGAHEEGEYYDTISSEEECTIRFTTADIGQRCVLHCHVLFHEDAGSMSWVNVTGPDMPRNDVQSFQYQCPAIDYQSTTAGPAAAPTVSPTHSNKCVPGYLGLHAGGTPLSTDETYVNEEFGVFIIQQGDGNLVVFRGTPEEKGDLVWASGGILDGAEDFFSQIEADSSLVTYEGTPDDPGQEVFSTTDETTAIERQVGEYFLGIDCNSEIVSVYAGSFENPRDSVSVWNHAPTTPPTAYPTRPPTTAAPTLPPEPTASPTGVSLNLGGNTTTTSAAVSLLFAKVSSLGFLLASSVGLLLL